MDWRKREHIRFSPRGAPSCVEWSFCGHLALSQITVPPAPRRAVGRRGRGTGDGLGTAVGAALADRSTGYLRTTVRPCSFRRFTPIPNCVRACRELHDYGFRYLITSVTLFGAGSVCSSFPPFKSPPTESAHRVSRPAPWSFGSNGASACLRIATVAWRPRPAVCLGVRLVSACPPLPSDPTPTRPSMY